MKLEEFEKRKVDPDFASINEAINNAVDELKALNAIGRAPLLKPDYPHEYEDRWHEACYIARYMFAYSYEYLQMYKDLLNLYPESKVLKILSLGCGSMVDAWSLHRAIYSVNRDVVVKYYGVDAVVWEKKYVPKVTTFNKLQFINDKAGRYLKGAEEIDFDVIVFPKSIGDIYTDTMDFQRMVDALMGNTKQRFFLVASKIVYSEQSLRSDESVLEIVVKQILAAGYRLNKRIERKGEDKAIASGRSGYFYPIEIDVNEVCNLSGRYPILKRTFENYSIYEFIKER